MLDSFGDNKIGVIKVVRAATSLGLKEAKDAVETLPSTIKEGIPKEEAENVKKQLEAAGAAVVLPQSALTGLTLARTVAGILGDPERVRVMGAASLAMRRIDAAEVIVRECYALMDGHHGVIPSGGAAGV